MPTRPRTGLEIDGFTLGECLYQAGFATIWAVTHPQHAEPMVMKVPTILDGDDGPTIVGFEVEQMIMPRLKGTHVPRTVAIGDFAVMAYIVTERIPGHSLLERFKSAPLPLDQVADLGARMALAVHALHRQRVIHLDLKPDNILQRENGDLVLIDYGLSRHDQLPDLLSEEFQIPMGTYPYISPEQFLRSRDDLRSDIYALGVMLYEMATGKLPFGRPQKLKGVRRRLWADPEPPRVLRPEIPEWLQEIILRAIEMDPARRYQSAAQLLFDLQNPRQVVLTARGHKTARIGRRETFRRWRAAGKITGFSAPPTLGAQIDKAPILMVAVDLSPEMEMLAARLLRAVGRMLVIQPDARIACVNVIRTHRIGLDSATDDQGNNIHVTRLVALRAWASGLDLPEGRVTFSILENPDPGAAVVDYATHNHVDHILMGARGHSSTRRYLGSVSSHVVAQAPCSVTVIRMPHTAEAGGGEAAFDTAAEATPEGAQAGMI